VGRFEFQLPTHSGRYTAERMISKSGHSLTKGEVAEPHCSRPAAAVRAAKADVSVCVHLSKSCVKNWSRLAHYLDYLTIAALFKQGGYADPQQGDRSLPLRSGVNIRCKIILPGLALTHNGPN